MRNDTYEDELDRMLDRIFRLVAAGGWPYAELARRAGLAARTVQRIDRRRVRLKTVMSLARAVGLELTIGPRQRGRRSA